MSTTACSFLPAFDILKDNAAVNGNADVDVKLREHHHKWRKQQARG
jgi:hypothetical protein